MASKAKTSLDSKNSSAVHRRGTSEDRQTTNKKKKPEDNSKPILQKKKSGLVAAPDTIQGSKVGTLQSRSGNNTVFEKEYAYFRIKEENREDLCRQGLIEELRDCTFTPGIDKPREMRPFNEFLADQVYHENHRKQSLNELIEGKAEEESKSLLCSPSLNTNSIALIEKRREGSKTQAHIRLYSNIQSCGECSSSCKERFQSHCTFHPEISANSQMMALSRKNSNSNRSQQAPNSYRKKELKSYSNLFMQKKPSISANSEP